MRVLGLVELVTPCVFCSCQHLCTVLAEHSTEMGGVLGCRSVLVTGVSKSETDLSEQVLFKARCAQCTGMTLECALRR